MFHEIAHIALGHVMQLNGTSEDDEKEADIWAGNTLIPSGDFESFKKEGDYSEKRVIQFAKSQGISPGIVVGRLQREGMIKYNMLNNLKEKYEMQLYHV
ncbi:MAG: ImmA/IrrE family metallo-endopeptidase [Lachnospiraceae bacterium]|nr:ImmA/IrrE family metallo-endopeptidase [Lachnospiraceae bacterium]